VNKKSSASQTIS